MIELISWTLSRETRDLIYQEVANQTKLTLRELAPTLILDTPALALCSKQVKQEFEPYLMKHAELRFHVAALDFRALETYFANASIEHRKMLVRRSREEGKIRICLSLAGRILAVDPTPAPAFKAWVKWRGSLCGRTTSAERGAELKAMWRCAHDNAQWHAYPDLFEYHAQQAGLGHVILFDYAVVAGFKRLAVYPVVMWPESQVSLKDTLTKHRDMVKTFNAGQPNAQFCLIRQCLVAALAARRLVV